MIFEFSDETYDEIQDWLNDIVWPVAIKWQKYWPGNWFNFLKKKYRECWAINIPYGSAVHYTFSYHGIGYSLKVTESITGISKDFTEYHKW